ncbi:MAG: hypothetical protein K9L32_11355, partial [Chromatiaceae bacterium]|nr:hypothetical protein [Chromatiaceae bacterium]
MAIRFFPIPLALVLLLNGCGTTGPVGSQQVVTGDGYRDADQIVERIPEQFTPMSASVLAAEKERPVRAISGFLLIDDAGDMRAKLPVPFESRAGLATTLAQRLTATLARPGFDGYRFGGPIALTSVSLRELDLGWSPKLAAGVSALAPRLAASAGTANSTVLIIFSRADRVDEEVVRQVAAMQAQL